MTKNEKQKMIKVYEQQYEMFLLSNESEFESLQLRGMKVMMELFFTKEEINAIENNVRVKSEYQKDFFLNIEAWSTIEEERGVKPYLFQWTEKGVRRVRSHYDYLLDDYKKFNAAIELTLSTLERMQRVA